MRLFSALLVLLIHVAIAFAIGAIGWFFIVGLTGESPSAFFAGLYLGACAPRALDHARQEWKEAGP